jgi:hypothetical protein
VLYLDIYEKGLLEAQEREMVQQARVLAAVLGEDPRIDGSRVAQTFARIERRTEARLRVFSADGTLQADSRLAPGPVVVEEAPGEYSASSSARERALYRFGATLASVRDRMASAVRHGVVPPPKRRIQPRPPSNSRCSKRFAVTMVRQPTGPRASDH